MIPRAFRTYSIVLVTLGLAALLWSSTVFPVRPGNWIWVVGMAAFTLFTITWAFEIPRFGHSTLDRAVQLTALLALGMTEAMWVVLLSSLAWPLLNMNRRGDSLLDALTRSAHNSGMMVLVVLAGGLTFRGMGGELPMHELTLQSLIALVVVMLLMQAVNEVVMQVGIRIRDPRSRVGVSLFNTIIEVSSAPLGVVGALIYTQLNTLSFLLYVGLFVVILVVIKRFADVRVAAERQVHTLEGVNQVGRAVSSSLILGDVIELVYEQCSKLIEFSSFYLVQVRPDSDEVDIVVQVTGGQRFPRSTFPRSAGMTGHIINSGEAVLIEDWEAAPEEYRRMAVVQGDAPQSYIGVPVIYQDEVVGAMTVQNFRGRKYDADDLTLLRTFADQVAVALANARMYSELQGYQAELEDMVRERTEELEAVTDSLRRANEQKAQLLDELQAKTDELDRQSKEDGLTGLYNRRFTDHFLENEFSRARRFGHDLAVALADLDHFKEVNDRYSHGVGDQVLREVARILHDGCRGIDIIGRYGGEEFILCFPETSGESAQVVCEKLRRSIEDCDWGRVHEGLAVTISIGIADAGKAADPKELVARADQMLYAAKRAGRNRVMA